jgi:RNA polymerase sigma-70 factor (ECF subfamily)
MDHGLPSEQFERHRAYLQAVAYRMLGSKAEAEDAVQEAWLRLMRADDAAISNMAAWLTTVVGRVCIDMLRSRRTRREDSLEIHGPEVARRSDETGDDPEQQALIADSVGLALMVVLDTLAPAERLAFVLHDMFGVPYGEIALILQRTEEAARQLASRARRRVRGAPVPENADPSRRREIVAAFLTAARAGDFDALLTLLDPDVVFRIDPGSRPWVGPTLFVGRNDVARHSAIQGPQFASVCRVALVDGGPGVIAETAVGVIGVAAISVAHGLICAIELHLDPSQVPYRDFPDGDTAPTGR